MSKEHKDACKVHCGAKAAGGDTSKVGWTTNPSGEHKAHFTRPTMSGFT
jgi:hypothetical protein